MADGSARLAVNMITSTTKNSIYERISAFIRNSVRAAYDSLCRLNRFAVDNDMYELARDSAALAKYVGDDTYVGRSDNILGTSFHITPGQLYRCFTQQPPCEKRADDGSENNSPSAYGKYVDGCLNDAVDRYFSDDRDSYTIADVFYAGLRCGKNYISRCENDTTETNDITGVWIVRNDGLSEPVLVVDTKDNAYVVELPDGGTLMLKKDYVYDNFHRWTIGDASDGDILISGLSGFPFIFSHANKEGIFAHGGINTMGDFEMLADANMWRWTRNVSCPANHVQRENLRRKMEEKGYKWSDDSK